MRRLILGLAVTLVSCSGAAFNRVKNARTLEEARAKLEGYTPEVTHYGTEAEAWYFGSDACVLFVDGMLRTTQTTATWVEGGSGMQPGPKSRAFCAPSQMKE
jgi:hypothetical protein